MNQYKVDIARCYGKEETVIIPTFYVCAESVDAARDKALLIVRSAALQDLRGSWIPATYIILLNGSVTIVVTRSGFDGQ